VQEQVIKKTYVSATVLPPMEVQTNSANGTVTDPSERADDPSRIKILI
jgi:hypothetical protein